MVDTNPLLAMVTKPLLLVVTYGGNLYMWAASVRGLPRVHDSPEKRAFVSSVDVFHLESGDWV